jgi:hypothetical protein
MPSPVGIAYPDRPTETQLMPNESEPARKTGKRRLMIRVKELRS